ncbi:MAG: galactokinase [Planctomycetota bacterium]
MAEIDPSPVIARAPGRVNLIGEHTDYSGGLVMPVAIEDTVVVTAKGRPDGVLGFRSLALRGDALVPPAADPARVEPAWARLPAAVVAGLREAGLPRAGFDAVIDADLPPGGGLSSSAALAAATALAAIRIAGGSAADWDRAALARICRDAEARATGVRCGLMDPYVSLLAEEGTAMLLDCRSVAHRAFPVDEDAIAFVIADSGVRHDLAVTEYNRRREECERAVAGLDGVGSLRELAVDGLAVATAGLPDPLPARVRHVVTENARVLAAAAALEAGDAAAFGRLLDESHASLRNDFEVSCPELDDLAERARSTSGVTGARLTGGGFGGFVVAAVRPDAVESVLDRLDARPVVPSGGAWAATARTGNGS